MPRTLPPSRLRRARFCAERRLPVCAALWCGAATSTLAASLEELENDLTAAQRARDVAILVCEEARAQAGDEADVEGRHLALLGNSSAARAKRIGFNRMRVK